MNPAPAPASAPARRLPPGLEIVLDSIDSEDWKNVDITVCHSPTTKQLLHVLRFLDEILPDIGHAAFWVGGNRITGPEIEVFHERWAKAVVELVSMGLDVCRRMNRVETMQRHRKILVNFGHADLFEVKKARAEKKEPGPRPLARPRAPAVGEHSAALA